MTKLLLVSDNHGDRKVIQDILKKETYDLSAHLGDSLMSETEIKMLFDIYVSGNNEIFSIFEKSLIIEGLRFTFIHGHMAGIIDHREKEPGYQYAKSNGCDVLVFGHTHTPCDIQVKDVRLINPGSTSIPRNGSNKSYAIVEIDNREIKSIKFKNL